MLVDKAFLALLFFKEKKLRYCHHSGVVVVVAVVVVVTNFNLGYNFVSIEANLMKLHMGDFKKNEALVRNFGDFSN